MENDWVTCPYNSEHRLPNSRLPYHIVKCRPTYKGPKLETCPFNATHLVPEGKLREHFADCTAYYHVMRERLEAKYNNQKSFHK